MRKIRFIFALIIGLALVAGCSNGAKQQDEPKIELTISAAASLTDSLNEIQKLYEVEHPNVKLTFNFGASGSLQQQIEQGAPVDVFFSAGKKQVDALVGKNLMNRQYVANVVNNELVAVIPSESSLQLQSAKDLSKANIQKLALGEPEAVPAGSYSKEMLVHNGLWESLNAKMVFAKDVRQVLTYVESGNVDIGFVYKTDARISNKVKVAFTAEAGSHKPIEYPIGIVEGSKHVKESQAWIQFLQSKPAQQVFEKYGFVIPGK
ncbi:molybdate ABC transporter substrate-binding protein [Paenibacillus sp. N1-5-1-14]|uniref:molybdate ABC transporter substrate-binding protein n=1 Tax=Paenibacillus radicibacter TaxID=2972488 RepID=UPI0021593D24|nr:molybdate ABC transporter substrate-binding protein [Paenibacillus radicibacter]MCR8643748.1 molybdate ABC transporter substrate-binding protein [Paenibacillus radicibacter]